MKEIIMKDIADCPICGHSVIMRKNASKRFQVYCPKCHSHTNWVKKTEAIIEWYNIRTLYISRYGEKGKEK